MSKRKVDGAIDLEHVWRVSEWLAATLEMQNGRSESHAYSTRILGKFLPAQDLGVVSCLAIRPRKAPLGRYSGVTDARQGHLSEIKAFYRYVEKLRRICGSGSLARPFFLLPLRCDSNIKGRRFYDYKTWVTATNPWSSQWPSCG